jgi:TRAP transporter TAXI family solute receptor
VPHRHRKTAVWAALLATTLAVSACGGKQESTGAAPAGGGDCDAGSGRITIATGNSTGVYFVVGGGLAQVISKNTQIKASAAETGASVQNIEQLVAGDYDIAFSLADTAANAVLGKSAFEGKPAKVRALARIYPNYTQVVVRKSAKIKSLADLRGKTVSTGSPKSGTEAIAKKLLEGAGLNPDTDVKAQRLDLTKTVDGMKDGRIDALVWSGGLPTPALTDLFRAQANQVELLDLSGSLDKLKAISPVYDAGTIGKSVYNTPADVPTVVVPNVLLVREDMPAARACALTRLLFDKRADLEKVHPAAKGILLDQAAKTGPVQLHEGSQRALKDLGG